MTKPSDERLRNVGLVSLGWLREAGIRSASDLQRVGSVEAFCRVKAMGHNASLNLLYALEGALLDMDWRELPMGVKAELKVAAQRLV